MLDTDAISKESRIADAKHEQKTASSFLLPWATGYVCQIRICLLMKAHLKGVKRSTPIIYDQFDIVL